MRPYQQAAIAEVRRIMNQQTIMAPDKTPRWYDGEPKKPPRGIFRSGDARSALWLIRVVVSAPNCQVDHNG